MTDTYNKVAGALDESRALLAEVMAALTAAAERERVLREKAARLADVAEYLARTGMGTGTVLAAVANIRAALEATS